MKKIVKLSLTAAAIFAAFTFASCSNSSGGDNLPIPQSAPQNTIASEATTSVTELYFDEAQVNNKIFSCAGTEGKTYYGFKGGKCYIAEPLGNSSQWTDVSDKWEGVALAFDVLRLFSCKMTRTEGSGLFIRWYDGDQTFITLYSNGTAEMFTDGQEHDATFINSDGLITINCNGKNYYGLYDGDGVYMVTNILTFVKNIE